MPLPLHKDLEKIHDSIQAWSEKNKGSKKGSFDNYKKYLDRAWDAAKESPEESVKFIGDQLAERSFETAGIAVKGAGLHVAGVAVVGVGMIAFAPLSAALSPWLKAYQLSQMTDGIFGLYDALEQAKKSDNNAMQFHCYCGACAKNIQYMIDKIEWRAFHSAAAVGTLSAWWFLKKAHSAIKACKPTSKKGEVSLALVKAAGSGCSVATAVIFMRVVDKMSDTKSKAAQAKILSTVAAIICSEDGWEEFKELW